MTKLPAVMLYPNDWEGDEIAFCSLAAQGLWLRMMFLMHRSTRYGYLSLPNGSPIPPTVIATKCGTTVEAYEALLVELDSVGKLGRTSDGVIFSRRLVRDEQRRAADRKRKKEARGGNAGHPPTCPPDVRTDVRSLSGGITSSYSITSKEQDGITPDMIARSVLTETGLAGRDVAMVLDEVCRSQVKLYETPGALRDALIDSWRQYDSAKPSLAYTKGAAKFFGDGDWRNKAGWPWKEGKQPVATTRRYVNE